MCALEVAVVNVRMVVVNKKARDLSSRASLLPVLWLLDLELFGTGRCAIQ